MKFQGCPLHCVACVTPDSWDSAGGYLVPVDRLAAALLDPAVERDGISVLGGEPFFQHCPCRTVLPEHSRRPCDATSGAWSVTGRSFAWDASLFSRLLFQQRSAAARWV
ncbi:MAG: 4Fe-4S cluster-binding domain-containing protein [Chloroflexi bacterium]|nr:4Fe-4S cluster-binding domain-containing protein [Chloroflexota bacterium]